VPSFTNSNDPKTKCTILNTVRFSEKFCKKQHYSRLTAKSNNKIKTKWNIMKKETGKVNSVEQVPILLVNDEKLKDPTGIANAFNNFFLEITEKCNIQ